MTIHLATQRSDALRLLFAAVEVNHLLEVGAIPGTVILAAGGANGSGTGRIRSTGAGTDLQWRAPGSSTFGPAIEATADGDYVLEDGEDAAAFVRVRVRVAFLVDPNESDVLVRDAYNALGPDDVSAAEATAGAVETRQYDLTNAGAFNDVEDVRVWIDPATADVEISDDNAIFVTPTGPTHIDALTFATIAPGASVPIYMRRTIAALSTFDPEVLNILGWDWKGH